MKYLGWKTLGLYRWKEEGWNIVVLHDVRSIESRWSADKQARSCGIRVTTDHARKCHTNTQITKQFCYWVKFHQTHRACQSSFTALATANAQTKFHCSQRAVSPRSQTHRSVRLTRNPHLTLFRQRESLYGTCKMAAWELSKWIVTSNAYLRNYSIGREKSQYWILGPKAGFSVHENTFFSKINNEVVFELIQGCFLSPFATANVCHATTD